MNKPLDDVRLLLLTDRAPGDGVVVPALDELDHDVIRLPLGVPEALDAPAADVVLLDGTGDLGKAVASCRSHAVQSRDGALLVVVTFGALAAVKVTWGFDDWMLPDVSVSELQTRLRLARERVGSRASGGEGGFGLQIDADAHGAFLDGKRLELTYTEFELLRALVVRAGHVWTRAALLREVWGYDHHAAGTRTVDVHVTRLRAKLRPAGAVQIQTVRNVGYKLLLDA